MEVYGTEIPLPVVSRLSTCEMARAKFEKSRAFPLRLTYFVLGAERGINSYLEVHVFKFSQEDSYEHDP